MSKAFILTRHEQGFPVLLLNRLAQERDIEVAAYIKVTGPAGQSKGRLRRKWKKLLRIGLSGLRAGFWLRTLYADTRYFEDQTSAKEACEALAIPYLTISSTSDPRPEDLDRIRQLHADWGISAGNDMIDQKLFTIPEKGMMNIHHEILPQFRGAQSIIWQIHEGSTESGYTVHRLNERIDGGEILEQESFQIEFRDDLADTIIWNTTTSRKLSAEGVVRVLLGQNTTLTTSKKGKLFTTPSGSAMNQIRKNFSILKKNGSIS